MILLDSHIDIPWPDSGADPGAFFSLTDRCADLVKMKQGGLNAACFVAYVPQDRETPEAQRAAYDRAMAMLDCITLFGTHADTALTDTAGAVQAAFHAGRTAIIPAVENGTALGGTLSTLAEFRAKGVRYLTLCHNGHNLLCDSSRPLPALNDPEEQHGGLSGMGREAIAEMNRLGLLVDVSHGSIKTMMQASEWSKTPIVATHSSVRALCNHTRNLTDEQLDRLRDTGGLVQITAVSCFLRENAELADVSLDDYCDHIDYAVQRCGIAHVGIGSDFDGGGGVRDWRSVADTPSLTAKLRERGYDDAALASLWGGNFLRLMRLAEEHATV